MHLHVGFPTIFVCITAAVGILWISLWYRKSKRDQEIYRELEMNRVEHGYPSQTRASSANNSFSSGYSRGSVSSQVSGSFSTAPHYSPQPAVMQSNDLVTGIVLGEMLSGNHHHDTIIERDYPSHSDFSSTSGTDYSSSSSTSSGIDFSTSDSGSSFDFGSSSSDSGCSFDS